MDGIDGASGRTSSPWEDDFDRPLPGAAQKDAVNVANAPWLTDATKSTPASLPARGAPSLTSEIRYPAAVFSNPAMFGPAVSL
ncbi:MAG: hypothetical protein JWO02_619, partial [Solirubrobacterales bacterium]|nr:hypothetical protein [Solirubrobacterales bacterium]